MHLIMTGATGLVGSAVLHEMICRESVTRVSVLSRRPVAMADGHDKVNVIIHNDFMQYPAETLEKLKGAEGAVWALGVSVMDVTKEMYETITFDYPLAAAKAFAPLADPFKFVYVSGEGATTTPGMFTPAFGVVKGRAESSLLALSKTSPYASLSPFSLRPAGVDAGAHPEILPFIPVHQSQLKKVANAVLLPTLKTVYKNQHSPTKDLARILVDLAMGDGKALKGEGIIEDGRTISNKGMRRLAGI